MKRALKVTSPEGSTFTKPMGGLFFWVELPGALDATAVAASGADSEGGVRAGAPFFATAPKHSTLRLTIRDGMQRLGAIFSRELRSGAHHGSLPAGADGQVFKPTY